MEAPVAPPTSTAISDNAAMMNLVKCAVGAGSLSLPFAFKQGGVLFAFLLTILIGALSSYTVILLKRCEEAVAAVSLTGIELAGSKLTARPPPRTAQRGARSLLPHRLLTPVAARAGADGA